MGKHFFCYKHNEADDLTNGAFELTDELIQEAREQSYNGIVYEIDTDDNYCSKEYEIYSDYIKDNEGGYMTVKTSSGNYRHAYKTLDEAIARYVHNWDCEVMADKKDDTFSLEIAKDENGGLWFAVGSLNDFTNWLALENGASCDFSNKGEVYRAIQKATEDWECIWDSGWNGKAF